MSVVQISFEEGQANLDWLGLCQAFDHGHELPRAEISDTFLYRGGDTLLNRSAWIDGLGLAVKCATVFPDNPKNNRPMINGGVSLFSDETGLGAVIQIITTPSTSEVSRRGNGFRKCTIVTSALCSVISSRHFALS